MRHPVIFIGMHRSGTSMLGRLMEDLGLFAGTKKEENNEAVFFQDINKWLMGQCGARWDTPEPTKYLIENEELLGNVENYVRTLLDSSRAVSFLGLSRYLTAGGITRLDTPWGWKDPRNTYTLAFWLRIFPQAKVLYIERHGVDVAQSLKVRNQKAFERTVENLSPKSLKSRAMPFRRGFMGSPRCATVEGGFSLWLEYIRQAEGVMQSVPEDQLLRIKYEDLLENPFENIAICAEFCGLDVVDEDIERVVADIDGSRAFSFLSDDTLLWLCERNKNILNSRLY